MSAGKPRFQAVSGLLLPLSAIAQPATRTALLASFIPILPSAFSYGAGRCEEQAHASGRGGTRVSGAPDGPALPITNAAPGRATIWWTPPTPGFTLRSTDNFAPTSWGNASSGTNHPATAPARPPMKFYRPAKL